MMISYQELVRTFLRTAINYCYNNIYFLFYFVLACKNLEKGGV
ncbi:hypothetical protein LR67_26425 [Escherichia coli]|nr:hypothetical protein LR67_26425 [Escherichia coli]